MCRGAGKSGRAKTRSYLLGAFASRFRPPIRPRHQHYTINSENGRHGLCPRLSNPSDLGMPSNGTMDEMLCSLHVQCNSLRLLGSV
jgi:hypothetical protein